MGATVVFMVADSVVWLFVARGIQGLATGLALGAASAALLDLHPRRDPAGVGLTNGVVSAGGMGLGVLVSATFVELLPAPRVLPYVALFVLFAIAFVGVARMPEPVEPPRAPAADAAAPERPARRPRPVRARRPRGHLVVVGRRPVPLARPAALGDLFHTTDHLVAGLSVFALAGSGAAAQLLFGRTAPWLGAAAGSVALATGPAAHRRSRRRRSRAPSTSPAR